MLVFSEPGLDLPRELLAFLKSLQQHRASEDSFNPWADYDGIYDESPQAPRIRRTHLGAYLSHRIFTAKYILVAEAVGYQGAKFSGVPLTSERILLGKQKGIGRVSLLPTSKARRTSKPERAPSQAARNWGYGEPTATIVWSLWLELGLPLQEVIFWNIFPFHPFKPQRGSLSNRTPRRGELALGQEYLDQLRALCPPQVQLVALGEKAGEALGRKHPKVRHPAQGGASFFRRELARLIG